MNSVDAIDFAIGRLIRIRMASADWEDAQDALDTLRGLRQALADQCQHYDVRRPTDSDNVYRCNDCQQEVM